MQQNQWEIIFLKPTRVFSSFLASQLPGVELPSMRLMQTDTTAYLIPKQDSDEAVLNEIEQHFVRMFNHEIYRWVGANSRQELAGSFLDFLCCFKFEIHSNIVLMEESIQAGKQLLRIKPRSVLLKWMKSTLEEQSSLANVLEKINLANLTENSTVIVKNFKDLSEAKSFIRQYYSSLFLAEMFRVHDNAEQWPFVDSYPTFCRYFAVDFHSNLIHLNDTNSAK